MSFNVWKTVVFFLTITVGSHHVHGICSVQFNTLQCAFDVTCKKIVAINFGMEFLRFEPRPDLEDMSICNAIRYSRYDYYPINLKYKYHISTNFGAPLPELEDSEYNFFIVNLDLSENNFNVTPELREMKNLAILNLSKNSLRAAKLSNTFQLFSLTEINLSHNVISEISYELDYIYRRLKKIDLSHNYITQISEAIFDPFDELETLDVSYNYINTLSTLTFDGMKQLINLNISHNRVTDINSSLVRFNVLKLLDLSNNRIKTIKTSDFDRLISLEILDLSSNAITLIERESFHNMPMLNSIYVNNNKLENIDKELLTNASNLRSIDLSENYLRKIPRGLFKGKNIRIFSIKDNSLEGLIDKGTFEGLFFVSELDLSNQNLESIQDFAFFGLDHIKVLLLNKNQVKILSSKCFRMLHSLETLDLSYNKIESIEFEKDDLYNLLSLSLRNNYLRIVGNENFHGLNSLQYLDLSNNKLSQVETNSFKSLKELINFEISNNPLNGTLKESTFDGLNSLPSLDISCTLLSTIQNGSFVGMFQLNKLNISHSKINTLEYNIFIHTGAIETIDLSFNELKEFYINNTELAALGTLYLNNNQIKTLGSATFQNILRLSKLALSHNVIQNIDVNIFAGQEQLHTLDLSYNNKLKFTPSLLNETKNVNTLNLSGIDTGISFGYVKGISLSQLTTSNSSIIDVKSLQINELRNLDILTLSFNNITKLEPGDFNSLSILRNLDLSHNKITNIQPGVFKDNTMLVELNISHNMLTAISYGIFHGLIFLHTLDISYNKITDLKNERFYEVASLSILIADHNNIESINAEEFIGTSLSLLSIGGNPISCDVLAKLNVPFNITARTLYENNNENIHGVTCNIKSNAFDKITNFGTQNTADNVQVLLNIRDILLDHFNNQQPNKPTTNLDEDFLVNITDKIQSSNAEINKNISSFLNFTAQMATDNNKETNTLLNKILKVLTQSSITRAPPIQVTKDNATYENLLSYINKVKQEIEINMKLDKDEILNEVEAKISAADSRVNHNLFQPTETAKYEKLSSSVDSKSVFTETCVALILTILVCFVLFKVYKSGIFVRRRFSVSTRELPGAMDSTL